MLGAIALGIYYLVLFKMMYLEIVHNESPLIVVEERPYRREVVVDNPFDCRLYHRMPKYFCRLYYHRQLYCPLFYVV